ncbi:hypothetical protein LUTEI9C_140072 [Luteimonas sp. 9C]|nr:hypothetical protein LUTEI9C_140072 [Luteimonas sp. 9C]
MLQCATHSIELVHFFPHVHGYADRVRRIGYRPGDSLTDPPGCVGRELEATAMIKLLNSPQKAQIAFLYEIHEWVARSQVSFRDRYDQPIVGLGHLVVEPFDGVDGFREGGNMSSREICSSAY